MANQDYPGVCMGCSTPDWQIVAPDVSSVRERMQYDPLTGYTKNVVNNLTFAMPDKFTNEEDAYMAFDTVKAVIAMGLKNKDHVDLHGLGEFRIESDGDGKKVVFVPDPALTAVVNE
jgi:hypothetical protein